MKTAADQQEPLRMWVVYFNPNDFPGLYVVRERLIYGEGVEKVSLVARTGPTLKAVRELIPNGLHCMPRFPDDDPVIVETWF